MPDNVRTARSSSLPSSPLTFFDPHEMADSIRRSVTWTDPTITADITALALSGKDFLDLSTRGLRKLSKNNDQVFQELRKLQKISSDAIPSLSSPIFHAYDWRLPSIFPELTPLIHNHRLPSVPEGFSGSSDVIGPQIPEDLNYEAFDYGDDEVEPTPDHHAVAEVAVPQDDLNLPDHSLQPDASVHPALENGPSLASTLEQADISEANALINGSSPQNDDMATSAISFPITLHTATTPARDDATNVHGAEEAHNLNVELQPSLDEPINADEASIHELDESQLVNPLRSQSAGELDEDNLQNDDVLVGPDFRAPSTRSSSPALSYVDPDAATQLSQILFDDTVLNPHTTPDPNMPPVQDRPPIFSRPSSPATMPPSQVTPDFLEASQLENSLTSSLEHPQIQVDGPALVTEDEKALEPPHLPASEIAATLSGLECSLLSLPPFLGFLHMPDLKPYEPVSDTCFDVNEALNGQTYEAPQSPNTSEETPDDAVYEVAVYEVDSGSKDPRDSFTSNHAHESIESCQSSPQSSPSSSTRPLDSAPHLVNIQSAASSSTDETLEDPLVDLEFSSTQSPSWPSTPARLEDHHDLNFDEVPQSDLQCLQDTDDKQSNVDMNLLNIPTHGGAFTLPVDIISVTPPGSPILEGLSQYMILHGSEAPGGVFRVNQDNVPTPVQRDIPTGERTLWPPSEAPRFGLLSSSGNGQSLRSDIAQSNPSGSDVDIAIQPNLPCPHHLSHVQVRDLYLGMSTSPYERIQLGLLRVIPSLFALNRETINRTPSNSA